MIKLSRQFAVVILFCLLSTPLFAAKSYTREQLTVKYLYNFCRHVTWPNESKFNSFDITVFYPINHSLKSELKSMARTQKIKGLPIKLNFVYGSDIGSVKNSEVVFMSEPEKGLVDKFYANYDGDKVLLITEGFQDQRLMMLNLYVSDKNLLFKVNKANVLNQGLGVNPDIVLHGGSEVDVAKLYKEGQASLVDLQNKLQVRESKLEELAFRIQKDEKLLNELKQNQKSQADENKRLAQKLVDLQEEISASESKIVAQKQALERQGRDLNVVIEQKEAIESKNKDLLTEMTEKSLVIDNLKKEIKKTRKKLEENKKSIESFDDDMAQIKERIKSTNLQLKQKNDELISLGGVVANQKTVLFLLEVAIALAGCLIFSILAGYRRKRKDNLALKKNAETLEFQKSELKKTQQKLIVSKKVADNANAAKSEFLANMSHEIRTPMNAIIGFSELLTMRENDPKKLHYLQTIRTASNTLLDLINDILDLAKIEAGKVTLQYSPVDLSQLIWSVKHIFDKQVKDKKLDFIVELAENIPQSILLDDTRIRQILVNLLSNAIKFTDTGSIKISVCVSSLVEQSRVSLELAVSDTGIGIPKSEQEHIFGSFNQNKRQKVSKYGGTGLGLTITSQLVELMGGEIVLTSEEAEGSVFTIKLPDLEIASMAKITDESLQSDFNFNFAPATILVADDIDYNREILINSLEEWDFEFLEAANGQEVLDIMQVKTPDLILIDMKMPVMGGLEAVKILRDKYEKLCPVVAVSATTLKEDVAEIKQYCDGFLTKPLTRECLLDELSRHIKSEPLND